uniref:Nitric oxide synthase-interacting protein homolog n=1 Tax=Hirondellea gigas TaxID=1518452 RepID=A0A6A7G5B7_9CRUS
MTRHAKNNTALGWFTSGEKAKLKRFYGSQKTRVGAEAVKDFDACSVCLSQAYHPVCCRNGHLFCRECILKNLLDQKLAIKQQKALFDQQQLDLEAKVEEKKAVALAEELERFDKAETTILPTSLPAVFGNGSETTSSSGSKSSSSSSSSAPSTRQQQGVVSSKAIGDVVTTDRRTATGIVNKRDKQLPCFWLPDLIPDAHKRKYQKPSSKTFCPGGSCVRTPNEEKESKTIGKHHLSRKDLIPVNFIEIGSESELQKSSTVQKKLFETGRYMCPACRKTLMNTTKTSVLRRCGHVICQLCITRFVEKSKTCVHCDRAIFSRDIIPLELGGSGFAKQGAQIEAQTYGLAFQC